MSFLSSLLDNLFFMMILTFYEILYRVSKVLYKLLRVYRLHFTRSSQWLAVNLTNQSHLEVPLQGERTSSHVMGFRPNGNAISISRERELPFVTSL